MDKQEFIKQIAAYVKKYAPSYNIKVYSPIMLKRFWRVLTALLSLPQTLITTSG